MNTELHTRAKTCADRYLKAERELFNVLIEVDRTNAFEDFEHAYLTPYCIKELKIAEPIAQCLVRIVRKTLHVPELGNAVLKGAISIYKAKAVCSVITPENAQEWIGKAAKLSKAELEKEVAKAPSTRPATLICINTTR